MTKGRSQTTPQPSDAHAKKVRKEKVALQPVEDAEENETLVHLPPVTRLTPVTLVKKVRVIPKDPTPKEKAKTTLPHATLAIANPNLTLALTVVAPVTTHAIASNALLMRKQKQLQSNK